MPEGADNFPKLRTSVFYAGIAFLITLIAVHQQSSLINHDRAIEINTWIKDTGIEKVHKLYTKNSIFAKIHLAVNLASLVKEDGTFGTEIVKWIDTRLTKEEVLKLGNDVLQLKNDLVWKQLIIDNSVPVHHAKHLESIGIRSLTHLAERCSKNPKRFLPGDWDTFPRGCQELLSKQNLTKYSNTIWKRAIGEPKLPWCFLAAIYAGLLVFFIEAKRLELSTISRVGLITFIRGNYIDSQICKIKFYWSEPQVVGNTVKFVIRFFQRNGGAYRISDADNLLIEITQGSQSIAHNIELGGLHPSDTNKAQVQFSARRAGDYNISVLIGLKHIGGSPFFKLFLPGPPDPQKTEFVNHCSTVVCIENVPHQMFIAPKDKYSNECDLESVQDPDEVFTVDVIEVNSERPIDSSYRLELHPHLSTISLIFQIEEEGIYHAVVSIRGMSIPNGDFHIIVLNETNSTLVDKNVSEKNHNVWYEAKLVSRNGENLRKPRRVFCYVSPKQLAIKEYWLMIIPKNVSTFRLCPSTKFQFRSSNGDEVMVISDGCQEVKMLTSDRGAIAATFTQYLLKNIGGSETFKGKQDFFFQEVQKFHKGKLRDTVQLYIQRETLLESSMQQTASFNTGDWCKKFMIRFVGEEGVDCGGLKREWFELVCSRLFDSEHQLFQRFKNDKQGLVHPNPKRPAHLKLKYFEFAGRIVGKCLYESALGSLHRQLVKARFSRSFLSQLIGLRVQYSNFEQDDPELYLSKIKYIIENDITSIEQYFVEEEYGDNGKLLRVVDLIPNGSKVVVTNSNKHRYLDVLAQHRLAKCVKDEVDSFLKGLNELIPDNLLCIFDEKELELLMCGIEQYSIADFKASVVKSGVSFEFRKIMDWFWTAVSNYTEEEMARLLQFTTGCSLLPPGGFGELNPPIRISASHTFGNLPTAHTCFNQLCLPDYDCYERFEKALHLAIHEGSEGFELA